MAFVLSGVFFPSWMNAAVVTLSPGIAFENNGQTQSVLLETSPQKFSNHYIANHHWNQSFLAQVFVGQAYVIPMQSKLTLNLGATLGYVNDMKLNGVVQQFGLADFDNLTYRYTVNSLSAMGTAKVLYAFTQNLQPYMDASLGFSNNQASSYGETPRILGAVPMLPFGDHSTNRFAYSVGVGCMYASRTPLSVGLGYQFSDLGQASLGVSAAQQTSQTLSLNHLYVHQVLLNFSWMI
jgi:opacity protein-like surface antigen